MNSPLRDTKQRLLACAACLMVATSTISGFAQQQQSNSGFRQVLPLVPVQEHRKLSNDLETRDLRNRPADDQQTVDDFLKSLQSEDAVIEIIVGRGRLITLEKPLSDPTQKDVPVVAVGDPTVLDIDIMPNPRMIRLLGKRVGMTDLSLLTADGRAVSFQVQVGYDLHLLRAYLKQIFPTATLNIVQLNEHLIVKGQARNTDEVNKIIQTLEAFLVSAQIARTVNSRATRGLNPQDPSDPGQQPTDQQPADQQGEPGVSLGDTGSGLAQEEKPDISATLPKPQIINLLTVPGTQQIMLQVRIAELDRTALRQMGADWFIRDSNGNTVGTQISSAVASLAGLNLGPNSTSFGIFPNGQVDVILAALRSNQVLNILAEPNLVAMHGHEASFLAGGEFPIPVPSGNGFNNTIEFKKFGVQLNFVPFILDDGLIRLHVAPEVSTIDPTLGVELPGPNFAIPGLNTRRVETTVELRQGQTLAIAGLLQVEMDGATNRIPGLGDLPILGPLFSSTSHERKERELLVLVTPYFADPMDSYQVPCLPGSELKDPTDHEFYFENRIEGLQGHDYRATTGWNDPLQLGINYRQEQTYQGRINRQQYQPQYNQPQYNQPQYQPQYQPQPLPQAHQARRIDKPYGFSR